MMINMKEIESLKIALAFFESHVKEEIDNKSISSEKFSSMMKNLQKIKKNIRKLNSNLLLRQKSEIWRICIGG